MVQQHRAKLGLVFLSAASVFFGTFANAASVGAKTVNGPLPLRVVTRSARPSSDASVLKLPAATAVSTMFLVAAALASGCGARADDTAGATMKAAATAAEIAINFMCLI